MKKIHFYSNFIILAPVITCNGGKVEDGSIINYFNIEDTLTLTCKSLNKLDSVTWKIVNLSGNVQLHTRRFSDSTSRITFWSSISNFSAHIRCSSNRGLSHKSVTVEKGKIITKI